MLREICVVTGTRAEYGLLKPIIKAIKNHPRLKLLIIVAGMHLSNEFGCTINEIEKDGFKINESVHMNPTEDTSFSMAESIGRGVINMANALNVIKPEILLVLGDRTEALAACIAAAYMNIPIAHVHGGDSAKAGLDESARHAITKFSHIHFPATKKSAERIIKMGEDRWRVHVVGAPGLDTILNEKFIDQEELSKKYMLDVKKPLMLLVQHSVTTEVEEAGLQMHETLNAIVELRYQTVLLYPNSDAGGRRMIKIIKEYAEKYPYIKTYKSISHKEYLSLMKIASVMIGNSSSGIIEAPSFRLPVVNIGTRQNGRQRAENIIDIEYEMDGIIKAIQKALFDEKFKKKVNKCKSPYGDGKAGQRIVNILSKIKIDNKLIQKRMSY